MEHTHVWIAVASTNWLGHPVIVTKCACGDVLTPEQIIAERARLTAAGVNTVVLPLRWTA